jgi:hypothetical protein
MDKPERLPPPPVWRTRYFACEVMAQPDRRGIDFADIQRALLAPAHKQRQADGHLRLWYHAPAQGRWLRVVTEPDGETVHNAMWDRDFEL